MKINTNIVRIKEKVSQNDIFMFVIRVIVSVLCTSCACPPAFCQSPLRSTSRFCVL